MLALLSALMRPCSSLLWDDPSALYSAMRQRRLSIPCAGVLSATEADERTVQTIPSQTSTFSSKRVSHKLRHHDGHRCSDCQLSLTGQYGRNPVTTRHEKMSCASNRFPTSYGSCLGRRLHQLRLDDLRIRARTIGFYVFP